MTYLQLVNDVLARLREEDVMSVSSSDYSMLVGKWVNDAKYQVESAWEWDALHTVVSVSLTPGTSNYVVTGSGIRQKSVTVNNTTDTAKLTNVPLQWILDQQQLSTVTTGSPCYYAWNGNNGTDSKVEVFPTPDAADVLKFNMYVPQAVLSADADVLLVPSEAVIAGAYSRALVERGEDGGLNSSEAYMLAKAILADQIAIEANRDIEYSVWTAC
jgi:hypothetical protein